MNIVILDGGTTNPGDISWEPLERLGALRVYGETPASLVVKRGAGADVIVMNRIVVNRDIMEALPALKLIATLSTGYNTIDIAAAKELGITVCNVPHYCSQTVAQMAFALLLELCGKVSVHNSNVRNGRWSESAGDTALPIFELWGKTLGLIGCGSIGRAAAGIGKAFGMDILIHSRSGGHSDVGREVSLDELLMKSDVVSIHCPLNDSTRGMIHREKLSIMKPTAFIINTARGAVINENDLSEALNSGTIAGAGLDVMVNEPPEKDCPLLTAKNCVITPHIGWASRDARLRLVSTVAGNIKAYFSGSPENVVTK